jgi:hypothetical protein
MWEHTLVTATDVAAGALWAVVADVPNWPAWQPGVEAVRVSAGGRSVLIREGRRQTWAVVEEVAPPTRLVVVAPLFLAQARTTYELTPAARGTRISVAVRLIGPLQFPYRAALGRRLELGLPEAVRRLVEVARRVAGGPPGDWPQRAGGRPAPVTPSPIGEVAGVGGRSVSLGVTCTDRDP